MTRRRFITTLSLTGAHALTPSFLTGCVSSRGTQTPADIANSDLPTVYIHGINQTAGKVALKAAWDTSLFGKPQGRKTAMAYWGSSPPDEKLLLQGFSSYNLKPAQQEKLTALYEKLSGDDITPGLDTKIIPLPSPIRKRLTRLVALHFIKELADFLFVPERRTFMVKTLLDEIPRDQNYNLISHSMGTIIAYYALKKEDMRKIQHFTTLGSPLGIPEVLDFLKDWFPEGLGLKTLAPKWVNIYDEYDIVAWNKPLARIYSPPRLVQDIHKTDLNPDRDNPHSSTGYLRSAEVQAIFKKAPVAS